MEAQVNHAAKATTQAENFKPFEIAPTKTESLNSLTIGRGSGSADQTKQATENEVAKKTIPSLGIDFGNNPETVAFFGSATRATARDAGSSSNPTDKAGSPNKDAGAATRAEGASSTENNRGGGTPSTREGRDQRPGRGGNVDVAPPADGTPPQGENPASRVQGAPSTREGRDQRPGRGDVAPPADGVAPRSEDPTSRIQGAPPNREGRDQRPGRGAPAERAPHPGDGRHVHPGKGDVGHPHPESPTIVDRNPSAKFVEETRKTTESVRAQMPPHIREMLKGIDVTPVKSIKDKQSGDTVNGAFGEGELLLAEKRVGGAKLESVLKHEFGHAFDENNPTGKELSADPEFRKLVDAKTPKDMLKNMQAEEKDTYYAEVFADLFAANMKAPSKDLAIPSLDKRMPQATEWVKRKMQP